MHAPVHLHGIERFIRHTAHLLQRMKSRMKSATTLVDKLPRVGNSRPTARHTRAENARGSSLSKERTPLASSRGMRTAVRRAETPGDDHGRIETLMVGFALKVVSSRRTPS